MIGAIYSSWGDDLGPLLTGLKTSLLLAGLGLGIGLPIGLLLALCVSARSRVIRWPGLAVVEGGRAAPALILLQLAYFGLPSVGLTLGSLAAATVGLAWITAAYSSEIFRAGLGSVARGQHEAASALGMAPADVYRHILVPQGIRVAIPSLLGLSIQIFQATALAFTVALPELMSAAYDNGSATFRYLSVLTLAGVLYAAIVIPAGLLVRGLELRMGRHLDRSMR